MKFALKVEEELNKILYPEYRQLVVEAMMVLSLILERDAKYSVNRMLKLDEIVTNANRIFLAQQVNIFVSLFFISILFVFLFLSKKYIVL